MSVEVVEVGTPGGVVTVHIGGASAGVVGVGVPVGASKLDDLTDVDGAAAATTGQALVKAGDGQWRPATAPGGSPGQVRATFTAAAALSGQRVVTRLADGTVGYASNLTAAHLHAPLWLTLGAAAAGAQVDVLIVGVVTEPSWAWTAGPLYLGVDGLLMQPPPSAPALFLAQVGVATGPTAALIERRSSIALA